MTIEVPTDWPVTAVTVLSSSRATSRTVGVLAWVVLEELALHAAPAGPEGFAVDTNVRELAGWIGVGKDTVAAALARLADLGLVRSWTRRRAGRYAGCTYALDADACLRAGLVLIAIPGAVTPRSVEPCPVDPDAVVPDTMTSDGVAKAASEPAAPLGAGCPDPTAQSLLDDLETPSSSDPDLFSDPFPVPSARPSTTSPLPASQPDLPSSAPLPLTPSCQPDALAPGVRRGRVNVPGNGAGEQSALNGNLNGEAGSGC